MSKPRTRVFCTCSTFCRTATKTNRRERTRAKVGYTEHTKHRGYHGEQRMRLYSSSSIAIITHQLEPRSPVQRFFGITTLAPHSKLCLQLYNSLLAQVLIHVVSFAAVLPTLPLPPPPPLPPPLCLLPHRPQCAPTIVPHKCPVCRRDFVATCNVPDPLADPVRWFHVVDCDQVGAIGLSSCLSHKVFMYSDLGYISALL